MEALGSLPSDAPQQIRYASPSSSEGHGLASQSCLQSFMDAEGAPIGEKVACMHTYACHTYIYIYIYIYETANETTKKTLQVHECFQD